LIDVAAIGCGPAAPLNAIDRTQIAIFAGPFIPNGDATFTQPIVVALARQKPQKFLNDGAQMNLFGGDQRKAFVEVKAHLVAKNAGGAGAGSVGFEDAMVVDMAHEIFVLRANGACGHERL
jgi:hypothetical protein